MYTEQDSIDIGRAAKRSWIGTGIAAGLVLAVYIYALAARVEWLAYAAGALLFVAVAYGAIAHIIPNERYQRFLRDMKMGGSHDMAGTIVTVDPEEELQDGVRVLPVHLLLDEDQVVHDTTSNAARRLDNAPERDERILYLNATKAANFPPSGTRVKLRCFGRHITACEVTGAAQ